MRFEAQRYTTIHNFPPLRANLFRSPAAAGRLLSCRFPALSRRSALPVPCRRRHPDSARVAAGGLLRGNASGRQGASLRPVLLRGTNFFGGGLARHARMHRAVTVRRSRCTVRHGRRCTWLFHDETIYPERCSHVVRCCSGSTWVTPEFLLYLS